MSELKREVFNMIIEIREQLEAIEMMLDEYGCKLDDGKLWIAEEVEQDEEV
jgi:hypothetical protein